MQSSEENPGKKYKFVRLLCKENRADDSAQGITRIFEDMPNTRSLIRQGNVRNAIKMVNLL